MLGNFEERAKIENVKKKARGTLKSFFGKCYEKMPSSTTTININISNLANNNKEVLILIQQAIVIILL